MADVLIEKIRDEVVINTTIIFSMEYQSETDYYINADTGLLSKYRLYEFDSANDLDRQLEDSMDIEYDSNNYPTKIRMMIDEDKSLYQFKWDAKGAILSYSDSNGNWWDREICSYPIPFECEVISLRLGSYYFSAHGKLLQDYNKYATLINQVSEQLKHLDKLTVSWGK